MEQSFSMIKWCWAWVKHLSTIKVKATDKEEVIICQSTIAKWPTRPTGGPESIKTHMQLSLTQHTHTQCHEENPIMPAMEGYLSQKLFISERLTEHAD